MSIENYEIPNIQELLTDPQSATLKVLTTRIERLVPPGENYGGEVLKVEIDVHSENYTKKVIHAVAKKILPNDQAIQMLNIPAAFKSEINFYRYILPALQKFEQDQGCEEVIDCFPRYYGSRINMNKNSDVVDRDGVLLIEDLTDSGYCNTDRHLGFDLESAKTILNEIATFHAVSLAMKIKTPRSFTHKIKRFCKDKLTSVSEDQSHGIIIDILWHAEECIPYITKIKENYNHAFSGEKAEPRKQFAGLCHNDLWINNLMLKYENSKPLKGKIIDMGNYNYGSVASDLIYFLFTSISTVVLKDHLDDLIKFYHDKLIDNLMKHGCSVESLGFSDFQDEMKSQAKTMFYHLGIFVVFIIFAAKNESVDFAPDTSAFDFNDVTFRNFVVESISKSAKERLWFAATAFGQRNWF